MSKKSTRDMIRDLANEIDVFDDMLASLVEVLEEKGVLTQEEWESKIKLKFAERSKSTSYRIYTTFEKGLSSDIIPESSNRTQNNVYSKIRQPELLLHSTVDNENQKNFLRIIHQREET